MARTGGATAICRDSRYNRCMQILILLVLMILCSAAAPAQHKKPLLDPKDGGPAQRIWSDVTVDNQNIWLRRRFQIGKRPKSARMVVSCDDECSVFVNGHLVATARDWTMVTVIDIANLRKGNNAIAVHAKNRSGRGSLVLWLSWTDAKGKRREIVTDKRWRVAKVAAAGWRAIGFDDKLWKAAKEIGRIPFARASHGQVPSRIVFLNRFAGPADAIQRAVDVMRRSRDEAAALRSLKAIEEAVMEARRRIWTKKKMRRGERERSPRSRRVPAGSTSI